MEPETRSAHQQSGCYPIAYLSRSDMLRHFPEWETAIQTLEPGEVSDLADEVGEALQETYWAALEILLAARFGKDGVGPDPPSS
jgi:hypothetical protein